MARPHRPVRGSVYQKRRIPGSATPAAPGDRPAAPVDGLSGADAVRLGKQIDEAQERYRVAAIRLIDGRACGVLLADSVTGGEQLVTSVEDWRRLQAERA
jgi:hypothetical protein